jgi:PAS domain S-box-containing protein
VRPETGRPGWDNDHVAIEGPTGIDGPSAIMIRNDFAVIISVDEHITEILGWEPEELVGRPSTEFVHPEDQPGTLATWFEMMQKSGETYTWQGRYRTPEGT